ncbi:hypothetical protein FSARC_14460 [Fusarium sarcochroum]|uniref:NmrA-like domain-containing protein n=1 Tax=Fusarium sarcochroum TaxID=1208366 RepID=A0A8H4WPA0_9HYPO|nr:hypothetical protein FSARC_14460 [Fusarium sarcochroum]
MLLLIIGITGDLGQRLAREAIARGIQVRGLARNLDKLKVEISEKLQSFIRSQSYGDISALDKAMAGVDAVICAYTTDPVLFLDGNLAALRAAERAQVKIFVASSFTNDWTNLQRGDFPVYDSLMSFNDQAELTSPVKPVFIVNGTFAEWLFPAQGPVKRTYYGNADQFPASWTTMDDAAAYTIEILLSNQNVREGKGGVFRIRSGEHSLREQASILEKVTGERMELVNGGTLEDAEKALKEARKKNPYNFWGYVLEAHAAINTKGLWEFKKPVLDLSHVRKPTTLEEFLSRRSKAPET